MAGGRTNLSSVNCYKNNLNEWKFEQIYNHKDCSNLTYDRKRIKWSGSFDMLQSFVECGLKLHGNWSSPGGNAKKFTCLNSDLTITWYARKQNTLVLHGDASLALANTLITVCGARTTSNEFTVKPNAVEDGELSDNICMPTISSVIEQRHNNNTNAVTADSIVDMSTEIPNQSFKSDVHSEKLKPDDLPLCIKNFTTIDEASITPEAHCIDNTLGSQSNDFLSSFENFTVADEVNIAIDRTDSSLNTSSSFKKQLKKYREKQSLAFPNRSHNWMKPVPTNSQTTELNTFNTNERNQHLSRNTVRSRKNFKSKQTKPKRNFRKKLSLDRPPDWENYLDLVSKITRT
ncbi:Hypothetical predicted protein [Paramuricea clavata]|uniref:Uncharacterized protein n=1 Tax=Paramuricea clavata TaxID=317549 RepID=A0A7D9J1E7_PARCT|nr:Hypothetical predicted protein [Paramuricea clavata]